MRFFLSAILFFFFSNTIRAQNVQLRNDSVNKTVTAFPFTDLLPPEFKSPALENEYCSDSNSVNTTDLDYVFVLKLRGNCTFFYEIYYKSKSRMRVGFYIGTYTLVKNTIQLNYQPLLSRDPYKIYISPTAAVSWSLPKPPDHLIVKKSMLLEANKKERRHKTLHIQNDKLQFETRNCH